MKRNIKQNITQQKYKALKVIWKNTQLSISGCDKERGIVLFYGYEYDREMENILCLISSDDYALSNKNPHPQMEISVLSIYKVSKL